MTLKTIERKFIKDYDKAGGEKGSRKYKGRGVIRSEPRKQKHIHALFAVNGDQPRRGKGHRVYLM